VRCRLERNGRPVQVAEDASCLGNRAGAAQRSISGIRLRAGRWRSLALAGRSPANTAQRLADAGAGDALERSRQGRTSADIDLKTNLICGAAGSSAIGGRTVRRAVRAFRRIRAPATTFRGAATDEALGTDNRSANDTAAAARARSSATLPRRARTARRASATGVSPSGAGTTSASPSSRASSAGTSSARSGATSATAR